MHALDRLLPLVWHHQVHPIAGQRQRPALATEDPRVERGMGRRDVADDPCHRRIPSTPVQWAKEGGR